MKLVSCSCPSCGATLTGLQEKTQVQCKYCDNVFYVDDGVQRVEANINFDMSNAETVGYNLEMGRLRAQQKVAEEEQAKELAKLEEQKLRDRRKKISLILLWVVFFPVMATIYILKSTKLSREIKFFFILILLVIVLRIFLG